MKIRHGDYSVVNSCPGSQKGATEVSSKKYVEHFNVFILNMDN